MRWYAVICSDIPWYAVVCCGMQWYVVRRVSAGVVLPQVLTTHSLLRTTQVLILPHGEVVVAESATSQVLILSPDLLLTTYYLPLTTYYSLLTTHYSLLPTHYSLLTTHYLLLTTQVLILSPDGQLLSEHGRRGEGPTDMNYPRGARHPQSTAQH